MLFNSYGFIFAFLPATLLLYYLLQDRPRAAQLLLVLASLFFYGWWYPKYLPVLVISALINYGIGSRLSRNQGLAAARQAWLTLGLGWNIGLLGYFKYTDFLLWNYHALTGTPFKPLGILLPLGISFFTFQKIAYLVDSYRGLTAGYGFVNYLLFVSFFPQLIAGPIVHHQEMNVQFRNRATYTVNWDNLARGTSLFVLGLAKKSLIADNLAQWANAGFDQLSPLNCAQAWAAALSYTLQLYFDFSGYTDMAIGGALLFNLRLPINFNSPYQATDIRDFWRRWHMTLSRFLRDYIYIPLGGNRRGSFRQALNLMITFLVGGIWHGAAWTFVFWGAWHGAGVTFYSFWERKGLRLPVGLGRFLTFLYVMVGWVFFRAKSWGDATKVLKGLAGLTGGLEPAWFASLKLMNLETVNTIEGIRLLALLLGGLALALWGRSSTEWNRKLRPTWGAAAGYGGLFALSLFHLHRVAEFLYFNF